MSGNPLQSAPANQQTIPSLEDRTYMAEPAEHCASGKSIHTHNFIFKINMICHKKAAKMTGFAGLKSSKLFIEDLFGFPI
jgi:hypothetical protein